MITLIELLLILILLVIAIFLSYYFFRGSTGAISLTRPVESRVDEYLDRKFEEIIQDWSLVRRPDVQRFKDQRNQVLDHDESRISELKQFEKEMTITLDALEERLTKLERSVPQKE